MVRKGAGDREFSIHLMIYSNRLAYLQQVFPASNNFGLWKQSPQKS